MIVKIQDTNMDGALISTNTPPDNFAFFPAFKASGVTFCFITDGMSNYLTVPFDVITLPDSSVSNADRMVSVDILDYYGLPHGKP